jgi:hypothetical protein
VQSRSGQRGCHCESDIYVVLDSEAVSASASLKMNGREIFSLAATPACVPVQKQGTCSRRRDSVTTLRFRPGG